MLQLEPLIKEQFETLFDNLHQKVFRFCFRVLQDHEDTLSVCESMWAAVISEIADGRPPETEADLIRMASRECIEFLKSQPVRPGEDESAEDGVLGEVDWATTELAHLEHKAFEDAHVRKVMKSLTPRQRVSIVLKYHYGARYQDVSRMLDINTANVRSHLRSGLIMASRILNEAQA